MGMLLLLANWLVPLIYLALVVDYGTTFFLRVRTHARSQWIIGAIVFHALFLTLWGIRFERPPLATNQEILSLVALCSAVVYWLTELADRDRRAGVFILLLIFLCQYTSSTSLVSSAGVEVGGSAAGWGRLHVLPATFAYTALAFAAVYGLLYLVGQRTLKRHRFGLLFDRLPALDLLGRRSWHALLVGLAFMTLAILTGAVFWSLADSADPRPAPEAKVIAKIVIGSIAWAICVLAVSGKLVGKWSASRVCRISVVGFAAVVVLLVLSMVLS